MDNTNVDNLIKDTELKDTELEQASGGASVAPPAPVMNTMIPGFCRVCNQERMISKLTHVCYECATMGRK